MKKYLIIICGWHYSNNQFYQNIKKISEDNNVDIFISSHKTASDISKKTFRIIKGIKNCKISYFANEGYDWGAFNQAIEYLRKDGLKYKYLFFMHDDIKINNLNFLDIFSKFVKKEKIAVLGNCRNQTLLLHPWPKTHPHIIKWAKQSKFKIKSKKWNTMRGSFFVAKRDVFEKIKEIPIKKGKYLKFGNWSEIAFAGMISDKFGKNSIKTMSKDYLVSPYILEYYRGHEK